MTEEELRLTIIDDAKKYISLYSKRLCLLLEYVDFKDINLIEKIILCNFINEIACNIQIETENITQMLIKE